MPLQATLRDLEKCLAALSDREVSYVVDAESGDVLGHGKGDADAVSVRIASPTGSRSAVSSWSTAPSTSSRAR
jgi:hypothetical protein